MGTLKDLCKDVPSALLRVQTDYNLSQRKAAAYAKRMQDLDTEKAVFVQCKRERTQKRVRNGFSREEAGVSGQHISVKRFATSQRFVEKRGKAVREYTLTSYTSVAYYKY